jgi:hypothetical protein
MLDAAGPVSDLVIVADVPSDLVALGQSRRAAVVSTRLE